MSSGSLSHMSLGETAGPRLAPPMRVESRPGLTRNVGDGERIASLVAGGILAGAGAAVRGRAGLALAALGGSLIYRGATGRCHAYSALGLNSVGSVRDDRRGVRPGHGVRIDESVHINRSPEEVSRVWGTLTNLPTVMRHLKSVEQLEGNRSHWVGESLGMRFEWDAETTAFVEGREIRFRSLPGGDVDVEGVVRFDDAPHGGTLLRVEMRYDPPAGVVGDRIAGLFGRDLDAEVAEDIRRFKDRLEAGEVPTSGV